MVCPVEDTRLNHVAEPALDFFRGDAAAGFLRVVLLAGFCAALPFTLAPAAAISFSTLSVNTDGSASWCLRSLPCIERTTFSCSRTDNRNPGVLAERPRYKGINRMDVMGFPSGRFFSAVRMSRSEHPLLTEEAAAGVAVHTQVDLAVRHGADVVRQPGATRTAFRRCRSTGRASCRPVRQISGHLCLLLDG